ncbi:hypothetical protein QUC31_018079, partial [Theobroma cacao]
MRTSKDSIAQLLMARLGQLEVKRFLYQEISRWRYVGIMSTEPIENYGV